MEGHERTPVITGSQTHVSTQSQTGASTAKCGRPPRLLDELRHYAELGMSGTRSQHICSKVAMISGPFRSSSGTRM